MTGITVNPDRARRSATELEPAAGQAGAAASKVSSLAADQSVAKWGVQRGPHYFRTRYLEALEEMNAGFRILRDRLDAYVAGVNAAVDAFEAQDSDVAARSALASPLAAAARMALILSAAAMPVPTAAALPNSEWIHGSCQLVSG